MVTIRHNYIELESEHYVLKLFLTAGFETIPLALLDPTKKVMTNIVMWKDKSASSIVRISEPGNLFDEFKDNYLSDITYDKLTDNDLELVYSKLLKEVPKPPHKTYGPF